MVVDDAGRLHERIADRRAHEAEAKALERQANAHKPPKIDQQHSAEVIPLTTKLDDYSFPDFVDELFEGDD